MKLVHSFLLFFLIIFLTAGCKKDSTNNSFYEKAVGVWVPYKMIFSSQGDSLIGWELIDNSTIFGTYRESIQLEKDKYYIAVNWSDSLELPTVRTGSEEEGSYTYSPKTHKLSLSGRNAQEWEVLRFENDELVLFNGSTLFLNRKK